MPITGNAATLQVGDAIVLSAEALNINKDELPSITQFTWTSSDSSIATIQAAFQPHLATVTAVGGGACTIEVAALNARQIFKINVIDLNQIASIIISGRSINNNFSALYQSPTGMLDPGQSFSLQACALEPPHKKDTPITITVGYTLKDGSFLVDSANGNPGDVCVSIFETVPVNAVAAQAIVTTPRGEDLYTLNINANYVSNLAFLLDMAKKNLDTGS
jgi:hypothetical protein